MGMEKNNGDYTRIPTIENSAHQHIITGNFKKNCGSRMCECGKVNRNV